MNPNDEVVVPVDDPCLCGAPGGYCRACDVEVCDVEDCTVRGPWCDHVRALVASVERDATFEPFFVGTMAEPSK